MDVLAWDSGLQEAGSYESSGEVYVHASEGRSYESCEDAGVYTCCRRRRGSVKGRGMDEGQRLEKILPTKRLAW